ncbi:hypothetical protein P43SY_008549 [Pythium insidiosum]|uniref:Integrase catalytic domain-containing protein n=1 Tax=Pythium insidiosum TaxID=114742 RepID=A0AAD5Q4P6_PYTIN|nr:hypothetical protein P43SY_008549 [Pythium insidiosum]
MVTLTAGALAFLGPAQAPNLSEFTYIRVKRVGAVTAAVVAVGPDQDDSDEFDVPIAKLRHRIVTDDEAAGQWADGVVTGYRMVGTVPTLDILHGNTSVGLFMEDPTPAKPRDRADVTEALRSLRLFGRYFYNEAMVTLIDTAAAFVEEYTGLPNDITVGWNHIALWIAEKFGKYISLLFFYAAASWEDVSEVFISPLGVVEKRSPDCADIRIINDYSFPDGASINDFTTCRHNPQCGVSRKFDTFCQQQGFVHQLTVPYSPQPICVAERMNRTIGDATRSTMIHRNMDPRWWAEVLAAIVHVLNRIPSTVRLGRSPFEIWFKMRPSLGQLWVIGSEGFAHIHKSMRGKLVPKAFRCMLLGYSDTTKGYRVWNKDKNKLEVVLQEVDRPQFVHVVPGSDRVVLPHDDDEAIVSTPDASSGPQPIDVDDEGPREDTQQQPQPLLPTQQPPMQEPPRQHIHASAPTQHEPPSASIMQGPHPQLTYAPAPPSNSMVPPSYGASTKSDNAKEWEQALQRELTSLGEHGVCELVRPPKDAHVVGCKWVFALKHNEKGEVCDVETAFLHGQLKATIYMRVPEGVKHEPGEVCRVKRSLHGLKQASAVWYHTITGIFKQLGLTPCVSDPCIVVKRTGGDFVYISLYVDDLLIAAKHLSHVQQVKGQHKLHFKMKDLGPAKFVIGMEIEHDMHSKVMTIKQSQSTDGSSIW